MATRGEAPTVLLLATEVDSEGASSSAPGGALDSNGSAATSGGRHSEGGPGDGDSRDTSSSDNEQSSVADSSSGGGRGGSAQPSSSSADTTASAAIGVDRDAGGGHADSDSVKGTSVESAGAARRTSARGAAGPDDLGGDSMHTSLRSPLPLSTFAVPSLADTKELDGHSPRRSGDEADRGRKGRAPSGGRGSAEGEASAVLPVSVNGTYRRSLGELGPGDEAGRNASDTDGSSAAMNSGGGGSDSTRAGRGEEEDDGWGGILEVDVRCSGSGNCPLHEAAASGSVGAVLSLLDLGADLSVANSRGDTALHVRLVLVRALLQEV